MPSNAKINDENVLKVLCSDVIASSNKLYKKFYFLYRSIVNPFKLFFHLYKIPRSVVLFNDFDQATAFIWVPLFHLLKTKHCFAVILHDPDRDKFFYVKKLSELTMTSIMSFMHIAFYHGFLPKKKYYTGTFLKLRVPHGIYNNEAVNKEFLAKLQSLSKGNILLGMLGNIRPEKNYEAAIDALTSLNNCMLLIAGKPANSAVSVNSYKKYAAAKKVTEKIIWIEEYLDESSFNAAIEACEIILLYYKPSFTSQSGMLNSVAHFKKKIIISDAESSLKETVVKYQLGTVIQNNKSTSLANAIKEQLAKANDNLLTNWQRYIDEHSWERHVDIAIKSYQKVCNEN